MGQVVDLSDPVTIYDASGRVIPGADVRLRAREQTKALLGFSRGIGYGGGGYAGASSGKRSLRNFNPLADSADGDTLNDLSSLRGRSRDLHRNSPLATGAIEGPVTSVVGAGLQLMSVPDQEFLGLTETEAKRWRDDAERIFRCQAARLDITREQHFDEMQELVFRTALLSGDAFTIRRHREYPGDIVAVKLQTVEADRCNTPIDKEGDPFIVDGVGRDLEGAPVRYFFSNRHPQQTFSKLDEQVPEWKEVPAFGETGRLVLHHFGRIRPGQTRGVPYLAPVIESLKQLDRYSEAELMAAVVSAYFTVFVKTETAQGMANETAIAGTTGDPTSINSPARDLKLGPAAVLDLLPNEDITLANPQRPNTAYEPFVEAIEKHIGVALEQPREVLTKLFTTSYSAARAAILEAWRFYRKRRAWLVRTYCQPVYAWVIEDAIADGLLRAPGFFESPLVRDAYLRAMWRGPAQGQIDPVKESRMWQALAEMGTTSLTEITAETTGADFRTVQSQRARDAATLAEHGVSSTVDPIPDDEVDPPVREGDA